MVKISEWTPTSDHKSKRVPAKRRYRVEKKIREHNKKAKREAKKNEFKTTKRKKKNFVVPKSCPFREEILNTAEKEKQATLELKKQKKAEKKKAKVEKKEKGGKDVPMVAAKKSVVKKAAKAKAAKAKSPAAKAKKTVKKP